MSGKAALIFVVGFMTVCSIVIFRMQQMETQAIGNMSNYVEWTNSHNVALAGIQVGLSRLAHEDSLRRRLDTLLNKPGPLSSQPIASAVMPSGPFVNSRYAVSLRGLDNQNSRVELRSVSAYPRNIAGQKDTLRDTVIVEMLRIAPDDFRILGLMMGFGGIGDDDWNTKDTMIGRMHINGRIKVIGTPVYFNKVTVSKGFSPPVGTSTNQAKFFDGYEEGVQKLALPVESDLLTDLFPCRDSITSPITVSITQETSLEFVGGDSTNTTDGFILARRGLHNFGKGVFFSTNQGSAWVERSVGLTFGNVVSMASSGANLIAGTLNGGVFRSANRGLTWTASGLGGNSIMALIADGAGRVYAGTRANGVYRSADNGVTWPLNTLAGRNVQAFAINASGHIFAGTNGDGVFRSNDNGVTWPTNTLTGRNVTALVVNAAGHVFAGTPDTLFRSTDNGATWTASMINRSVTSLAYESDGNVLYVGTRAHGVHRSEDNGASWIPTAALTGNPIVNCIWTRRTTSPTRRHVFVGTRNGGVFYSNDKGVSWTARNVTLKNFDVTAICDTSDLAHLYVGTSTRDTLKINDLSIFPNGVIYSTASLSVMGKVDTRARGITNIGITIGTDNILYINGDITYEVDPRKDTNSNDMLGLVARRGIRIYNLPANAPNDTSKKIWTVHAVMCNVGDGNDETLYAEIGSDFNPDFLGFLRTLGGIIVLRPLSISKTASNKFNGFNRYFQWDNRLASNKKPPCFPAPDAATVKSQLQIVNWWENVRFPKQ